MKIGIIAAMKHEIDELRNSLENCYTDKQYTFDFYCGNLNSNQVVVVESGMGKGNAILAATLLVEHFSCELIINTGIAGGLMPLETGDVCIATKLLYSDVDATIFGYSYGQVPSMPKYYAPLDSRITLTKKALNSLGINYKEVTIYSGDSFITSMDKLSCVDTSILCATEMEGCSVAQAAYRLGVDFMVIRYISDVIGRESQIENYNKFEDEMAEKSAKITIELLKQIEVSND
jgi:adenosylhomocysteine nucleosidase